jgi:hypothetical protein
MATLVSNNPAVQLMPPAIVSSTELDKTFQAADTMNGNAFLSSGNDLLIMFNSDSASHTVTIQSAPDSFGRFANLTYTVGAGVYSFVNITIGSLFIQPGTNEVLLQASSTLVEFLVVMNA